MSHFFPFAPEFFAAALWARDGKLPDDTPPPFALAETLWIRAAAVVVILPAPFPLDMLILHSEAGQPPAIAHYGSGKFPQSDIFGRHYRASAS
jgi:hypothetical protein